MKQKNIFVFEIFMNLKEYKNWVHENNFNKRLNRKILSYFMNAVEIEEKFGKKTPDIEYEIETSLSSFDMGTTLKITHIFHYLGKKNITPDYFLNTEAFLDFIKTINRDFSYNFNECIMKKILKFKIEPMMKSEKNLVINFDFTKNTIVKISLAINSSEIKNIYEYFSLTKKQRNAINMNDLAFINVDFFSNNKISLKTYTLYSSLADCFKNEKLKNKQELDTINRNLNADYILIMKKNQSNSCFHFGGCYFGFDKRNHTSKDIYLKTVRLLTVYNKKFAKLFLNLTTDKFFISFFSLKPQKKYRNLF